jgi:hypothetical protein
VRPALAAATLAAALVAVPPFALEAADAPREGGASGKFEDKNWKVEIFGGYAFRGRTLGTGDEDRIHVAVSNAGFLAEALDAHYDRRYAISTLFVDDETKVVYFEFDDAGKYHGLSYYFGPGDGCGWCFSTRVKSTVRPTGGRLKGKLSYKEDDLNFDVEIDVPIPPKAWGDALPRDGGEPGKAFLTYAAALEKRDAKAIYATLDSPMKARFDEHEKEGNLEDWLDYRWKDEHTELKSIRITGGFVKGDRAVVLFDGANSYIDHLHGEALMRREGGAWLFHTDIVAVGERD